MKNKALVLKVLVLSIAAVSASNVWAAPTTYDTEQDIAINLNTENLDVLYTAVGDLDEEVGKNMVNIQTNTNKITANRTDINANRTDINNINRINTAFDGRITNNERAISDLGYKVNELDDSLSAGIASAMALSSMPSQSIPGAHSITGGSGYYNGKGAVAIGLSGANDTGNVTYKIGGTYTEKGGSGFSVGGGWRWK